MRENKIRNIISGLSFVALLIIFTLFMYNYDSEQKIKYQKKSDQNTISHDEKITKKKVNIRADKHLRSKIVKTAQMNSKLFVDNLNGDWYEVFPSKYTHKNYLEDAKIGYVHKSLLVDKLEVARVKIYKKIDQTEYTANYLKVGLDQNSTG